ncbi:hypothetical protein ACH36K_10445 [Clostridium sp. MB05]|uniref:hypothetical protein n=1 Tax=Clostridium sp. MB05 TaxID=3376682 RepID=UPI0039823DB0
MKLLKKISLCITLILTIGVFYGCKSASPSDFVKSNLDEMKGANDKLVSLVAKSMVISNEEEAEINEELIKQVQKITYKITSEEVNKNEATVYIDINGPDFEVIINKAMPQIVKTAIEQAFSGVNMTEEEQNKMISDVILESIKGSEFTDRTGKLTLVKENKKWELADENELSKLLLNFDPSSIDYDNMEKYINEESLSNYLNE